MSATVATVLAHQGGWDELLFVAIPLVIFAALLAMARRRVDALEREAGDGAARTDDGSLPGGVPGRVGPDDGDDATS